MRASDRWLTPAVVCCLIVVGGVLIGGVIASVTWLTARGQDPDPMLRLTAQVTGAVASCLTLLLQIVTRRTQASVERQAGRLASGVEDVLDELDATRGRHTRTETQ